MISGLWKIAKILGHYSLETKRVEVSAARDGTKKRLETVTDADLMAISSLVLRPDPAEVLRVFGPHGRGGNDRT